MEEDNFPKFFADFMDYYENSDLDSVLDDKLKLDNSKDIISDYIEMFNEALNNGQIMRTNWLAFRYGTRDNFKLMLEWINHGFTTEVSMTRKDNFARSQENILSVLLEKNLLDHDKIQNMIKTLKRREIYGYSDKPRKLLEFHLNEFKAKDSEKTILIPKPEKQIETLNDLITHEKSQEIVSFLKIQFKNIKGKRLKLLLLGLQELNLIPKERIAKTFHSCCKREFNWDIASYNAMNGYEFYEDLDSKELSLIKKTIENFINS